MRIVCCAVLLLAALMGEPSVGYAQVSTRTPVQEAGRPSAKVPVAEQRGDRAQAIKRLRALYQTLKIFSIALLLLGIVASGVFYFMEKQKVAYVVGGGSVVVFGGGLLVSILQGGNIAQEAKLLALTEPETFMKVYEVRTFIAPPSFHLKAQRKGSVRYEQKAMPRRTGKAHFVGKLEVTPLAVAQDFGFEHTTLQWNRDQLGNPVTYLKAVLYFPIIRQGKVMGSSPVTISQAVSFRYKGGWRATAGPMGAVIRYGDKTYTVLAYQSGYGQWESPVSEGGVLIQDSVELALEAALPYLERILTAEEIEYFNAHRKGRIAYYIMPANLKAIDEAVEAAVAAE